MCILQATYERPRPDEEMTTNIEQRCALRREVDARWIWLTSLAVVAWLPCQPDVARAADNKTFNAASPHNPLSSSSTHIHNFQALTSLRALKLSSRTPSTAYCKYSANTTNRIPSLGHLQELQQAYAHFQRIWQLHQYSPPSNNAVMASFLLDLPVAACL